MHALLAFAHSLALAVAAPQIGSLTPPPNLISTDAAATSAAPAPAAQPEKPADPKPAPAPPSNPPTDPSTEDVLKEMEKQRGNAPAPTPSTAPPVATPTTGTAPASGTQPTTTASTTATTPGRVTTSSARLLREGTFLVDRRGRMVRSSTGDWLYTFDTDAKGQADPTMTLMPCQKLEAMEKLAERYGESLTFTVTGQVFVYKNRNHLLPATFRINRPAGDIKTTQ